MGFWQLTVPTSPDTSEGFTNFLWEQGALGVVEEEGPADPPRVRAFFPDSASSTGLVAGVAAYAAELRALGFATPPGQIEIAPLVEEAWASAWQQSFPPRAIGRRLCPRREARDRGLVRASSAGRCGMSRFHVRPEAVSGTRVAFDAQESRHLTRVLRLGVGAVVEALDGAGGVLTVRIERVGPRGAEGTVLAREEAASESPCRLVLAQGIPKGEKMEGIIRMATELGVARIVPLATARAVVRMEPRRAAARVARWQRVAKEAAKQSGRGVIPEIAQPMSLGPWLAQGGPFGLLVCLWEGATEPLQPLLPPPPCPHATLAVGPEGGLGADEADALRQAGAICGRLGPRILRTETAGPVGLALLQSRYGDLAGGAA